MSFVIFDVVILILLLLTAWKGYRRGFVLTLCSLLAVFVAFIGATVISSQLARPMSRLIQPALERSITQVLEEQTHAVLPPPETPEASQPPALSDAFSGEEGQEGEEDWLAQLPLDEVLDALQASSLYQHFIQPIQDAIQDGVMEVTTSAARAVADYLALELTLALKEQGRFLPGRLVLFSPWTDMTASGDSYTQREELDPMLTNRYIQSVRSAYAPDADYSQPCFSPLFGDLTGFPPTLVQVGEREILYSDSTRLQDALIAAGVPCVLQSWPDMWHVFQMFPLRQSGEAMDKVAAFLRT